MKGKAPSNDQIEAIYRARDRGEKVAYLAEIFNLSTRTIKRTLKLRIPGTYQRFNYKRGHPRATTSREDRSIKISIKRNRFLSNAEIGYQFNLSRETIRRRAIENALPSRIAVRDPLKKRHKIARRNWCRFQLI